MELHGSAPFVESDDELLWLALTARDFSCKPSELLGVDDSTEALDFDIAASLRLFRFDNERDENARKLLAYELAIATWGKGENADDETEIT